MLRDKYGYTYKDRVIQVADAIHEACVHEWRAIAVVDPNRMVTQHMADAHYPMAHTIVRRIFPSLGQNESVNPSRGATP